MSGNALFKEKRKKGQTKTSAGFSGWRWKRRIGSGRGHVQHPPKFAHLVLREICSFTG